MTGEQMAVAWQYAGEMAPDLYPESYHEAHERFTINYIGRSRSLAVAQSMMQACADVPVSVPGPGNVWHDVYNVREAQL